MTTEPTTPQRVTTPGGMLAEGDVIHFREPVMCFGEVRPRGSSLTLTAAMIERTVSGDGTSWLDRVDEPGGRIGRGPFPKDAPTWTYGDADWEAQREAARRRAWRVDDPEERAAALAAVERDYGPPAPTSTVLNSSRTSPEIRAAEAQERARREGGVQQRNAYSATRREV